MLLFFVDLRRPKINTRTIRSFQDKHDTHVYTYRQHCSHTFIFIFFYLPNISHAFTGEKKVTLSDISSHF